MANRLYENTKRITDTREDMSSFLFHLTKGDEPLNVLQKILSEDKLIAGDCGYICFTEAPITMLPKMLDYFAQYDEKAKFSPYGLGFREDFLFYKGARPVIYSDYGEDALLDKSIRWRYQEFHPIVYNSPGDHPVYRDYTWMREWRLPHKEFCFNEKECLVITKDSWENILFQDLEHMESADDIPNWKRKYKNISFQDIVEGDSIMSKQEFVEFISEQIIGEEID